MSLMINYNESVFRCPFCEKLSSQIMRRIREEVKCPNCKKQVLIIAHIEGLEALRLVPVKERDFESV